LGQPKIKRLVEDGAVILGPAPETTPGLADYPQDDEELKKLAAELWGTDETAKERTVGKGRVFRGMKPEEVLAKLDVVRDFSSDQDVGWIHRTVGGTEIYFVACGTAQPRETTCTFRVSGKRPEFWDPETGRIVPVRYYEEKDGHIRMPIRFEPSGSVFVVFRPGAVAPSQRVVSVTRNGQAVVPAPAAPVALPAIDLVRGEVWQPGAYVIETADGKSRRFEIGALPEPRVIGGPWELRFPPHGGAPEHVTLEELVSWSRHTDLGVKYFSGTAAYGKKISVPREILGENRHVYLDLGKVEVMARVKLNEKDLGVLWKPPYRVEITDAIQAGENTLEISVVNLWPNRMIGDEQLPEDSPRNPDGTLREWPQWLVEGKPSPTGRHTFGTWKLWAKDAPLQESGLLGPVRILIAETIPGEF
jgi:hypothetical protein